jgi:hypothetical protein
VSAEEYTAIIHRAKELWNEKNLAIIDELYAPAYINHDSAAPKVRNLKKFKRRAETILSAKPMLRLNS